MDKKLKNTSNALQHGLDVDIRLKNYNRWIYENISSAAGKKMLEIGCGMGAMIDLAEEKNRKITGIDIDEFFLKYSKKKYANNRNVRIEKCDCLDLGKKFKKGGFDSIFIVNVLEHIEHHEKALQIMNKLLCKGGKLAVFVPAFQALFGKLDRNLGHYRRYTKATLRGVLEQNGFRIEKIYYMNFIGFFGWYLNAKILKREITPEGQALFFDKYLAPAERIIEKAIKPPVGQSIIAIAVKK